MLDLRLGDSVLGPLSQFPDNSRQNQRRFFRGTRRETGCYFKTAAELFFEALEAAAGADHGEGRGGGESQKPGRA